VPSSRNPVAEQIRVAESVTQLPESDWASLALGRPALRVEVLKAITRAATRPLPLQVFLLEGEVGLAAAAVCEPVTTLGAHNSLERLLFGRAARMVRAIGASLQPVLLFKAPLGPGSAVLLRQVNPAEQHRLAQRLLEGIEARAAKQRFGIAFIGIPGDDELLPAALRDRGYLETEIQPTTQLDIEWTDFDGYVQHLRQRSKNAAQTARKERARNQESGVRIRQIQHETVDVQALSRLSREHYRHKNGREPLEDPEFLPHLAAMLGDDLVVFEAVRDGERVAMMGLVRSGTVGWLSWLGFETRDRPNDFTYYNLAFYQLADSAAALGIKTLLYGNSALKAKAKRGCRVTASHLFYRPHRRFFRLAAKPFFSLHRAWYRKKLQ
jgi:predicted N-acyltransferase